MVQRRSMVPEYELYDEEAQLSHPETSKIQRQIRHNFIKKVYGILTAQIILSMLVGAYFTLSTAAATWIATKGTPLLIFSAVMAFAIGMVVMCIPSAAENYPTNYILLFAFTLFESICLGGICGVYSITKGGTIVFQALICTSAIVVGLTLFAFQTKYDFVSWAGALTMVLIGLCAFGLVRLFLPASPIVETIFSAVMAVVFSCYIVIDTQLLLGQHRVKLSEDQYILGAITLYLDIINLFMYILRLLSQLSRDD